MFKVTFNKYMHHNQTDFDLQKYHEDCPHVLWEKTVKTKMSVAVFSKTRRELHENLVVIKFVVVHILILNSLDSPQWASLVTPM